jgi:hypothetical protein
MAAPPAPRRRRWLLLPAGALLGGAISFIASGTGGCVYHDTCIMVTSPGTDWCRNVALAKQWPVGGSFEDAQPILRPDGATPRGCRCYNDAELQILENEAPVCKLDLFIDDLEQAARQECQALVPPGFDHNCWVASGPQQSIVEGQYPLDVGACIGNCEYGAPPPGGSCPAPSPYECATGGGGDGACEDEEVTETTTAESGLDDTGSDTSGGAMLDFDDLVICEGNRCEIDEALARRLYRDPSPLLHHRTRLVYDTKVQRFALHGVEPGTLAYAVGLEDEDLVEGIDGTTIQDLDSALRAYSRLGNATTLVLRVKRGTRWIDFTYDFVPWS